MTSYLDWQLPPTALGRMTKEGNNPDVECLAMALSEIPLTQDGFGSQDWRIVKFLVVKVGKPGFAKVPYNASSNKKVNPNDLKLLYEIDNDGELAMYTFQKTTSNMNKGPRVDVIEDGEEKFPGCGVLKSGTVLKFFVQRDKVAEHIADDGTLEVKDPKQCIVVPDNACKGKYFINPGDMAVLNVRSKNVDQAKEGKLVNVTKFKLLYRSDVPGVDLCALPKSVEEYDSLATFVESQRVLKDCVEMGRAKYFSFKTTKDWYVNGAEFDKEQSFVLTNGSDGYEVPWKLVTEVMQCGTAEMHHKKARKVLELMVASGSVRVVVSTPGDVAFSDKDAKPTVLTLSVDYNKFLCLEEIQKLGKGCGGIETNQIFLSCNNVEDSDKSFKRFAVELKDNKVIVGDDERSMLLIAEDRKTTGMAETWQEFLEPFPAGGLHEMSMSLLPPPGWSYQMCLCTMRKKDFDVTQFTELDKHTAAQDISCHAIVYWQPIVRSAGGSVLGVRKRQELSDEEDMED